MAREILTAVSRDGVGLHQKGENHVCVTVTHLLTRKPWFYSAEHYVVTAVFCPSYGQGHSEVVRKSVSNV